MIEIENYKREYFKNKLKFLMLDKGIDKPQLCKLSGINSDTLRAYLNGRRFPKPNTLKKIADILEVSINDLLGVVKIDENHNHCIDVRVCNGVVISFCSICGKIFDMKSWCYY